MRASKRAKAWKRNERYMELVLGGPHGRGGQGRLHAEGHRGNR